MSIRRRLSVLFAAIWAGLYLVFTVSAYFSFRYHLQMEVDASLSAWSGYILESTYEELQQSAWTRTRLPDGIGTGIEMPDTFVLLISLSGDVLINRSTFSENELLLVRQLAFENEGGAGRQFGNHVIDGQEFRTLALKAPGAIGYVMVLGRSLVHVNTTLASLVLFLAVAWLLAVAAGSTVMWILVGYTLLPINRMTRRSLEIADSGELGRRIEEIGGRDEFAELSRALNRMLGSMQGTYESQKRFLADVSHELRTPLTSIRANIEYLRRSSNASEEEKAAALSDCAGEAERMAALVNDLLLLARTDSGPVSVHERVDAGALCEDVSGEFMRRKTYLRRQFRLQLPDRNVFILGDGKELRQALVMLLDNAFKYTAENGMISLSVSRASGMIRIAIDDDGQGIPPEELESVWQRFYRASNIRDKVPGSGLGLSIIRSIIERHSGTVTLSNRNPRGLSVIILLPEAP